MSIANSGGPAFPSGARIEDDSGKGYHIEQAAWMGMSLRDWFAGQALIGLVQERPQGRLTPEDYSRILALAAYAAADAMLKEREK